MLPAIATLGMVFKGIDLAKTTINTLKDGFQVSDLKTIAGSASDSGLLPPGLNINLEEGPVEELANAVFGGVNFRV